MKNEKCAEQIQEIIKKYDALDSFKLFSKNLINYLTKGDDAEVTDEFIASASGAVISEANKNFGIIIDKERSNSFIEAFSKCNMSKEIYDTLIENKANYEEVTHYFRKQYITFKMFTDYVLKYVSNPFNLADAISMLNESNVGEVLKKFLKKTTDAKLIFKVGTYPIVNQHFEFQKKIAKRLITLRAKDELFEYGKFIECERHLRCQLNYDAIKDVRDCILKALCRFDKSNKYKNVFAYLNCVADHSTGHIYIPSVFEEALLKEKHINYDEMVSLRQLKDYCRFELPFNHEVIDAAFYKNGKIFDVVSYESLNARHQPRIEIVEREQNGENLYKMYKALNSCGEVDHDSMYFLGVLVDAVDEVGAMLRDEFDNTYNLSANMKAKDFIAMFGKYDEYDRFTSRMVSKYLLEEGQIFLDEDPDYSSESDETFEEQGKVIMHTKNQH